MSAKLENMFCFGSLLSFSRNFKSLVISKYNTRVSTSWVQDVAGRATIRRNMSASRKKWKVLVTHPEVPKPALDLLGCTCEVIMCKSVPPKRSEILEKAKGVHGILWACSEPINAEVLDSAGKQLKCISTMSAGFDYVDVAELKKRKIPLGNTPQVLNDAVADQAMGLMLAAARRFYEGRLKIEGCTWLTYKHNWMLGQDIRDSTVGFFGFGNIGQTIAKRLAGFNVGQIIYTSNNRVAKDIEEAFCAGMVSFDQLLEKSDFIFIVAPLTEKTKGVFNAKAFEKMKDIAVLVNVARGPIINQEDLYDALKCKKIFAAGLDVMTPEPLPPDHPLMCLPNCVITPHLGSGTQRTRIDMGLRGAENVLRCLDGKPMVSQAYK